MTLASNVKKYGYSTVLCRFLNDVKILESNGLSIVFDDRAELYFGTVTMVIADNLAAHALGCFFENFSTVQRFCRYCMLKLSDYKDSCLFIGLLDRLCSYS